MVLLLALGAPAIAQDDSEGHADPFVILSEAAVSFFTPLEGRVQSFKDGFIRSDLGKSSGIKKGMRLRISKEGTPFLHPITKEPLGLIETPAGIAVVTEVGDDFSVLRPLQGDPARGDILRLSSARIRTLFHQDDDVEWNLSEKYYDTIKHTNRFDLLDTVPSKATDEQLIEEAARQGAELIITLTAARDDLDAILTQRLLWSKHPAELLAQSARVDADLLAELRLGNELFAPRRESIMTLVVPFKTTMITSGDIDGDGAKEVIFVSGSELSFNNVSSDFEPAFGGLKVQGVRGEIIIWVDADDIDGDGADELITTTKKGDQVTSYIYKYIDGKIEQLWSDKGFTRAIDGMLYRQKYWLGSGYAGAVTRAAWDSGRKTTTEAEDAGLPKGINIFDFAYLKTSDGKPGVLAYDEDGYLVFYDHEGKQLWRSEGDLGGVTTKFSKNRVTSQDDTAYWSIKDKLRTAGRTAFTIRRVPVSMAARGLGFKRSYLVGLRWMEPTFMEIPMVSSIVGNVLDFTVVERRAYILARPIMGLDIKKIMKGKNPLVNKLYIYSFEGQ